MDNEKQRDFQMRITQANKTELTIILYEMTIQYLEDGKAAFASNDKTAYQLEVKRARACIEEMINNLHFEYEIAKSFHQIYLYMKKELRLAITENDVKHLDNVKSLIVSMCDSYKKVSNIDTTGPVMTHIQTVTTGMTYGKNKILTDLTQDCGGRGFRV